MNDIQLHCEIRNEIRNAVITITVDEIICMQPAENLNILFLASESRILKLVQALKFYFSLTLRTFYIILKYL